MENGSHTSSPPNIKYRLLTPETFDETIALMNNHFFPREPISICLEALEEQTNQNASQNGDCKKPKGKDDWLVSMMRMCTTTIVAHDTEQYDKIVVVVIAKIDRKLDKYGETVEWYDMEISTEELINKWRRRNLEYTGKQGDLN